MDEDDEPREFGAEISDYAGLNPPYAPRNGPFETVEELLMVRGVTPELLFGRDVNRNGMIDLFEQNLPLPIADPGDGSMERGWSALLTLYSKEKNVDQDGNPRIQLNSDDLEQLFEDLSAVFDTSWATFIVAYRQSGPANNQDENGDESEGESDESEGEDEGDDGEAQPAGNQQLDFSRPGSVKLKNILELIGARTKIQAAEGEESVTLESPFDDDPASMGSYLPLLMDKCTVNDQPVINGRVNIMQAPPAVLMTVPGMTDEICNAILSQRDMVNEGADPALAHETWLLSSGIVTLDEMRTMLPFITARGDVYRAQVVGYFDSGGIAARAEVVIDATKAYPRVVFWRDISHLGRGFALDALGIEP
jgi:hypothetical protein